MIRRNITRYLYCFVLLLTTLLPNYAQGQPKDFTINSKLLKYFNQTYGFLCGQNYTLLRIQEKFHDLSHQAACARLNFHTLFGSAAKNLEKTLGQVYESNWPKLKAKTKQQVRDILSKTEFTEELASKFIGLVNDRGKGEVAAPFLQVLLMCDPEFQQNPAEEVIMGFKQIFRTKEHPKAKGLDLQIEYPKSWSAREGHRPNVIQFFKSGYGQGFSSVLIMSKNIQTEAGSGFTLEDLSQLNTLRGAKRLASQVFSTANLKKIAFNMGMRNARDISTKRVVLDRWPGAMLDLVGERKRLDYVLTIYNRTYFVLYKNHLISLQCQVGKLPYEEKTITFEKRIQRYTPLFHLIANSLVIQSQY